MRNSIGQLTLARYGADRDAATRENPVALSKAKVSDRARYVVVSGDSVASDGHGLLKLSYREIVGLGEVRSYYLGADQSHSFFAVDGLELLTDDRWSDTLANLPFESLHQSAAHLSELDTGLAVSAVALLTWLRTANFCPQDGTAATTSDSGWEKTCQQGHRIFPRMDPAVIMAIRDGHDRLLLGRNRSWPDTRFSTLAGFVEAGEPLESAVRREVMEEAGIKVGRVDYFGSQPWPFPRSLMLAFRGWTDEPDPIIKVDGVEVVEAFFVSRDELRDRLRSGEMALPGVSSVARALIEDWYGASIDEIAGR